MLYMETYERHLDDVRLRRVTFATHSNQSGPVRMLLHDETVDEHDSL